MTADFLDTVGSFRGLNIVVAGDLLLDHYIIGTTERTSPEAPVPVVLVSSETYVAGGAANVARNLAAAGARTSISGLRGRDAAGLTLMEELAKADVHTAGVVEVDAFPTIVKARVVSQGQQIVRYDYEKPWNPGPQNLAAVTNTLGGAVVGADAVILSDYGKGYLRAEVLQALVSACQAQKVRVFVDPKGRDYSRYRGAFAITPNSREAQEATGISTATDGGLRAAADAIYDITGCPLVVITRGADGLALRDKDGGFHYLPTSAKEVFDVTGAGDTFVAWITMGIAAGLPPIEAAGLANIAAGISVGRSGPAVVSPLDIRQALAPGKTGKKIVDEGALVELGEQLRKAGKKIVLTNGCFDFLHAGHVAFLQQAKALGDVLVLATNTDATITRLKGEPRPIIAQRQREEMLASIEAVDFVVVFAADTPHEIIGALRPDVLVKGSNYTVEQVEGAELIRELNGQVVTLPIVHNFHTDQLLRNHD